jgi:hypothetical protein
MSTLFNISLPEKLPSTRASSNIFQVTKQNKYLRSELNQLNYPYAILTLKRCSRLLFRQRKHSTVPGGLLIAILKKSTG